MLHRLRRSSTFKQRKIFIIVKIINKYQNKYLGNNKIGVYGITLINNKWNKLAYLDVTGVAMIFYLGLVSANWKINCEVNHFAFNDINKIVMKAICKIIFYKKNYEC